MSKENNKLSWSQVARSPTNRNPSSPSNRNASSPSSRSNANQTMDDTSPNLSEPTKQSKRLHFPSKKMGALIGKRGSTIKAIQKNSGAKVLLKEDDGKGFAVISGTAEQVRKAEEDINSRLSPPKKAKSGGAAAKPAKSQRLPLAVVLPEKTLTMPQTVLVLVGIPGSGKSTFSSKLAFRSPSSSPTGGKRVPTDFVPPSPPAPPPSSISKTSPPRSSSQSLYSSSPWKRISQDELKNRNACIRAAQTHLQKGYNLIVDRCNFDQAQRKHWLSLAEKYNAEAVCVELRMPFELCRNRVFQRKDHEGKVDTQSMNEEKLKAILGSMRQQYVPPSTAEGFSSVEVCTTAAEADAAAAFFVLQGRAEMGSLGMGSGQGDGQTEGQTDGRRKQTEGTEKKQIVVSESVDGTPLISDEETTAEVESEREKQKDEDAEQRKEADRVRAKAKAEAEAKARAAAEAEAKVKAKAEAEAKAKAEAEAEAEAKAKAEAEAEAEAKAKAEAVAEAKADAEADAKAKAKAEAEAEAKAEAKAKAEADAKAKAKAEAEAEAEAEAKAQATAKANAESDAKAKAKAEAEAEAEAKVKAEAEAKAKAEAEAEAKVAAEAKAKVEAKAKAAALAAAKVETRTKAATAGAATVSSGVVDAKQETKQDAKTDADAAANPTATYLSLREVEMEMKGPSQTSALYASEATPLLESHGGEKPPSKKPLCAGCCIVM